MTERAANSMAVIVASVINGRVELTAMVTPDLLQHITAVELINFVAQQVGGKGGGRLEFAQGGGTQPEHLTEALASVQEFVKSKLNNQIGE